MIGHTGLRRLDGIIWALVAAVAGLELLAVVFGGFTIVLRSYAAPGITCLLLMGAARYYRGRRADPNLASALESTAQIAAFAAVARPFPTSPPASGCRCTMRPLTAWIARSASTGGRCWRSCKAGRDFISRCARSICH